LKVTAVFLLSNWKQLIFNIKKVNIMDNQQLNEKRKKTEQVIANVYNLPAISGMMMEISRLLDDPSTNTQALSKIIGKDPGLTTKILSISNSPLYGLPRKVSTIDFAILIIGYQDIKNIVVALSMIESFKNKSDKNMKQEDFWKHSLIAGNAAKRISEDLGYRFGGEAFVAGLLHDLGIPVIHKYFHSAFLEIIERVEKENIPFLQAELEAMGMDHQEIGLLLSKKWNLPESLGETVFNHHFPGKVIDNKELVAVVHLADYMTQKLQIGNFYWDSTIVLDDSIIQTLKFRDSEHLDEFIESYRNLFTEEINNIRI